MEEAYVCSVQDGSSADGAYIDFALDHPAAYKLMFDVNQPTFAAYPDLTRAMQRARATMSLGVAGTGLPESSVELMSHVIWAAMHGPIMLELADMLRPPLDSRAILRETMTLLLQGLRSGERA